jgi:hypothetical protein
MLGSAALLSNPNDNPVPRIADPAVFTLVGSFSPAPTRRTQRGPAFGNAFAGGLLGPYFAGLGRGLLGGLSPAVGGLMSGQFPSTGSGRSRRKSQPGKDKGRYGGAGLY